MKAIVVLADTLRRDFLSLYGNTQVKTPNLERLREKSVVFDQHWSGSLPCMPARRDMLTGRLHFLERNWGGIEPFDDTLPQILKRNGKFSHIVTDHFHYFDIGGENYCQSFQSWDFIRGQEYDRWVSKVNSGEAVPEHIGKLPEEYHLNRGRFVNEEDYPSPMTVQSAIRWLEDNEEADNYLLWVEMFDPHEPFDLPQEYLNMYNDDYDGPLYFWPEYKPVNVPEDAVKHIRNRYAALVTMTDTWIGKLLDKLDEQQMWEDTMLIFTTDHGFMLGEHAFMGKNYMPMYNEITHIPLIVHFPEGKYGGTRVDALTQNTDILPTLLELFHISSDVCRNPIHGASWYALLRQETDQWRDYAIYGHFGKSVNITDGKHTYFRAAQSESNSPLNLYGSTLSTLYHFYDSEAITGLHHIEMGRFLKWTDFPVYRIPADCLETQLPTLRFDRRGELNSDHLLFDLRRDYCQQHPVQDAQLEKRFVRLLTEALDKHDAPEEQKVRLGLSAC